nr:DHHW family protein [bacterium]
MQKRRNLAIVLLFCAFLTVIPVCLFALPSQQFSGNERRYLAKFPSLVWKDIASGKFGTGIEEYMADHVPGRTFLVGLQAYIKRTDGRQVGEDILAGKDGFLFEAPSKVNETSLEKSINAINGFSQAIGQQLTLMLVPSTGYMLPQKLPANHMPYLDEQVMQKFRQGTAGQTQWVDLAQALAQGGDGAYYRTDHHWTSLGTWLGYRAVAEQLGLQYYDRQDYQVERFDGFHGSTWARSALWLTPAEGLEMWRAPGDYQVEITDGNIQTDQLFFTDNLSTYDPYTVFLDGNHSLVRITNKQALNPGKKALVIRDSFGNSLASFLAGSWEEVVLVDLRYYKQPLSEL